MKRLVVSLCALFFFLLVSCGVSDQDQKSSDGSITSENDVDVKTELNLAPLVALKTVGVDSKHFWSGGPVSHSNGKDLVKRVKLAEASGFSHVRLQLCADWILDLWCKGLHQSKPQVIKTVRKLINETDLHIVLVFYGYRATKGPKGKIVTKLSAALEDDAEVQQKFIDTWGEFAKQFSDIKPNRLSFNLLNEPEFELPNISNRKLEKWESLAIKTIKEIRKHSPDRVIIYEGIGKSAFDSRHTVTKKTNYDISEIIRPLPFPNIVYGFHPYEPYEFTQQARYRGHASGKPFSKYHENIIRSAAARLRSWAIKNQVPVMISETGCISYTDGKTEGPANPDDCGKWASILKEEYLDHGIGVTYHALEKEKTIFKRQPKDACDKRKQCWYWLPTKLEVNEHLLRGFGLN